MVIVVVVVVVREAVGCIVWMVENGGMWWRGMGGVCVLCMESNEGW